MNSNDRGWIGVDLDGTLAHFRDGDWTDITNIGAPIPAMVERVKQWIAEGEEVRIFTARAQAMEGVRDEAAIAQFRAALWKWTLKHIGMPLNATATKDFRMKQLWDDRAVQVEPNTGRVIADEPTPCPKCGGPLASATVLSRPMVQCFGECGTLYVPA